MPRSKTDLNRRSVCPLIENPMSDDEVEVLSAIWKLVGVGGGAGIALSCVSRQERVSLV